MSDLEIQPETTLIPADTLAQLLEIADLANQATAYTAFADYQELKAKSTLQAQQKDLENFTTYLNDIYAKAHVNHQLQPRQLYSQPEAWAIISSGLVETFKKHLALKGFAISSINRALASIRMYAKLAMKAGTLSSEVYVHIKSVSGYGGSEAVNLDDKRDVTRIGRKKAEAVVVDIKIVKELKKDHPDTPMGRRDRLILCLIFDHGLRASEVAGLNVGSIDVASGTMSVYRKKTNTTDRLNLTLDTLKAAKQYLELDALTFSNEPLLLSGKKGGSLKEVGMNREMISALVNRHGRRMAKKYGLKNLATLSSHDGRHQWATDAIEAGTPLTAVQHAGGWKSPAMVHRYANKMKIVNQDVKLNR